MATATLEVSVRVRGQWAMRVVPWLLRLRLIRAAVWATNRIRFEVRAGRGGWSDRGRLHAKRTDSGIALEWRDAA